MKDVKTFKDRNGKRVKIGDHVRLYNWKGELIGQDIVTRILNAGYIVTVFTSLNIGTHGASHGRHTYSKGCEKIEVAE